MKRTADRAAVLRGDDVGRFLVRRSDPVVLGWFAERLWVPHGRPDRLRRIAAIAALRRGATGVAERLAFGMSGRALLGERGIENRWRPALEAADAASRPLETLGLEADRWILLRDRTARRRHLLFAFGKNGAHPQAVLKLRQVTAPGAPLARDRAALESVRLRLEGHLLGTIPEPLVYAIEDGFEVLALSCLPGRSAYIELHGALLPSRCPSRHLPHAADWLAQFHLATRASPVPEARVPVHGDFWSRNLLLGADGTVAGVVDWEGVEAENTPLEDLVHFAITYALNFPWRRGERIDSRAAARKAFVEDNPVARALCAYFRRYSRATGLAPARIRSALFAWLEARTTATEETVPWNEIRRVIAAGRCAFSG